MLDTPFLYRNVHSLHFLDALANGVAASFAGKHNLEALEVVEVVTGGFSLHLLANVVVLPLGADIVVLEGLKYGLGAGATEEGHGDVGESQSLDRVQDSGEVFSINQDTVLVTDVNNNADLAVILTVADPADSTGFYKAFENLHKRTFCQQRMRKTLPFLVCTLY